MSSTSMARTLASLVGVLLLSCSEGGTGSGTRTGTEVGGVTMGEPGTEAETTFMEFSEGHNGGYFKYEETVEPKGVDGKKPNILFIIIDDHGWANAGWHSPNNSEVVTPHLNELVKDGIELESHYVFKLCSPSRAAFQTGRNPIHVNTDNDHTALAHNPDDPVSGFQGIPRNMTGIATKLAAAGYQTHFYGKWDVGMATADHTPRGRGYMQSLSYFHHTIDYWTQESTKCSFGGDELAMIDLWVGEQGKEEKAAVNYTGKCEEQQKAWEHDWGKGCRAGGSQADQRYNGYIDSLFTQHVLKAIENHDQKSPMFINWATHGVHRPLQVPKVYLDKYKNIPSNNWPDNQRKYMAAMVNFIDDSVGEVVEKLKEKGMWDDTLIVVTSDNGGQTDGGNNFPLRGGKGSQFEGGVRVNAAVSGGYLPEKVRGTRFSGLITGWDWYSTFSDLAGVKAEDKRSKDAGLPPIDSISMVDVILGRRDDSPREQVALGTSKRTDLTGKYANYSVDGVIRSDGLKILLGDQLLAGWTGPTFPNNTVNRGDWLACFSRKRAKSTCTLKCNPFCFFNVSSDPSEHVELSATLPDSEKEDMIGRLEAAQEQARSFDPDRGSSAFRLACFVGITKHNGHWGPFLP